MSNQISSVQQQSRLKDLIKKGKEQGFLTYGEVNDHLPDDISDPEQIEDIIRMINDMGITVYETAPDADVRRYQDNLTAQDVKWCTAVLCHVWSFFFFVLISTCAAKQPSVFIFDNLPYPVSKNPPSVTRRRLCHDHFRRRR